MAEGRRARNKRLAREAILEAVAAQVSERGVFEFSVPEVARLAGVSHRTVYNYFPNRQALLDAFSAWANAHMDELAGIRFPAELAALPDAARRYFRAFGDMPGIATAYARIDATSDQQPVPSDYRDRRERFRELVSAAHPDASDGQVDALTGLIAVLGSSHTWHRLTNDHGLDARQAGEAVGWLMELLVEAVDAGVLPAVPDVASDRSDEAVTAGPPAPRGSDGPGS